MAARIRVDVTVAVPLVPGTFCAGHSRLNPGVRRHGTWPDLLTLPIFQGATILAAGATMIWNPQQVESAALELPLHERARLAERLLASLDEDAAVEQAWAAEIDRRVADYRAGRLPALDGDAVLVEARSRLKGQ